MADDRVFQDAKRFASMFSGFIQAAEKWKDIASLHKAEAEAHERAHKLKAEIEELTAERDRLKAAYRKEVEADMTAERKALAELSNHILSKVDAIRKFGVAQ
jgi:predicted  nucleic acid-binding Zn-ribbon protein